jgi:hypothetical protein
MDPLLEQLEVKKGFDIEESHNLSALAFADDLIITASKKDVRTLILHTERYLGDLRTTIAARKSATFQIRTTKDSWYLSDPELRLSNGDKIPSSDANSTLCYLSGHISPWSGLQYRHIFNDLETPWIDAGSHI